MWPTARSEDSESAGERVTRGVADTLTAASRQWATPKSLTGGANSKREQRGAGGPDLQEQVYRFSPPAPPTPDGPPSSKARRSLNPLFVEWLMGWPIGWTDCASPVTGLSHFKQRMHTELSRLCSRRPKQGNLF